VPDRRRCHRGDIAGGGFRRRRQPHVGTDRVPRNRGCSCGDARGRSRARRDPPHHCGPARAHRARYGGRHDIRAAVRGVIGMRALDLLGSMDLMSLIALFWYACFFELPRYTIGALVVALSARWMPEQFGECDDLSFTILLVGHNEAKTLRKAVGGLA